MLAGDLRIGYSLVNELLLLGNAVRIARVMSGFYRSHICRKISEC